MARAPTSVGLTHESIWTATADLPAYPPLTESLVADVCVVGAGIAGMTAAYELSREGHRVVVLERGLVGGGMTAMTTAHLVTAVDDRYFELERIHDAETLQQLARAHRAAIDCIETFVRAERIDCDFARVDGFLTLGHGDTPDTLERELAAVQRAGICDAEILTTTCYPARGAEPCLRFQRQARYHPLRYLAGLTRAFERRGGRVFCDTPVIDIEGGTTAMVHTSAHRVRADAVIVATNSPITERVAIHVKQAPYMTYVIAAPVAEGSAPDALVWDTEDPYHFVRLYRANGDTASTYVIAGGEDHRTGQAADAEDRYARLRAWTAARYLTRSDPEYCWAGELMVAADRVAFIGRSPSEGDNVYIITGESGTGMTAAVTAARLLGDLIAGRKNELAEVFDPARRRLGAAPEYLRASLNVAAQYADWVTPGDVSSVDDIAPDSGAVLRRGVHKVAVYRDANGVAHEFAAACTHLGCVVRWHAAQRTWDCPCHGSRYDMYGRVLSGPAVENLRPLEPD